MKKRYCFNGGRFYTEHFFSIFAENEDEAWAIALGGKQLPYKVVSLAGDGNTDIECFDCIENTKTSLPLFCSQEGK